MTKNNNKHVLKLPINIFENEINLWGETLTHDVNNADNAMRLGVVGRIFRLIKYGEMWVSGQQPDSSTPLAFYLSHGGRVVFDLSDLDPQQKQDVWQWLLPAHEQQTIAQRRLFATHAKRTVNTPNDLVAECRVGVLKSFCNGLASLYRGNSPHWMMNIPIGGLGKKIINKDGSECQISSNGEYGVVYFYHSSNDPDFLMIGIESAGVMKSNKRTNEAHSMLGHKNKFSALGQPKLHDSQYKKQFENFCPPVGEVENNWCTVRITKENYRDIMNSDFNLMDLRQPTSNSKNMTSDDILDRKAKFATFQANESARDKLSHTWTPKQKGMLVAAVLAIVGILLCCIPSLQMPGMILIGIGLKSAATILPLAVSEICMSLLASVLSMVVGAITSACISLYKRCINGDQLAILPLEKSPRAMEEIEMQENFRSENADWHHPNHQKEGDNQSGFFHHSHATMLASDANSLQRKESINLHADLAWSHA